MFEVGQKVSKGHGPLVFVDGDLVFFVATIGALLGPASAGKGCELRKGLDTILSIGREVCERRSGGGESPSESMASRINYVHEETSGCERLCGLVLLRRWRSKRRIGCRRARSTQHHVDRTQQLVGGCCNADGWQRCEGKKARTTTGGEDRVKQHQVNGKGRSAQLGQ